MEGERHDILLSILTPLLLPSLTVSLYYFIVAVLMRECLWKTLAHEFQFLISMLNGTCFFDSGTTSAQCVFGAKN